MSGRFILKTFCVAVAVLSITWGSAALALDPSEMLQDPALEQRAQALDDEIRCVKCRSESVASSNADWAKDARRAIREQIEAGSSDAEVKDFFVARYGQYVLMDPPKSGSNLLLWFSVPVMLVIGAIVGLVYVRRRSPTVVEDALTDEDEARLKRILEE